MIISSLRDPDRPAASTSAIMNGVPHRAFRFLLMGLLCAVLGLLPACGHAPAASTGSNAAATAAAPGLRVVPLSSLPREAGEEYRLIKAGGPFPNRQDGVVFGNREGVLPAQRSGYYHEYTVPTPGSSDRGARRIVTGAGGEYYYTGDHYRSFVVVDVTR